MENIMQYIPLAVSAILLAALILTVITNIITQVVKKITWDKIPTNILAVLVAMAVTLLAFFAVCQIMGWAVTWYMVAGAVALGLFVSYAAMFGFDKLREALEQITNWGKTDTGKEDPRHLRGAGVFYTARRDTVEASRRMARSMIFFLVARFVSAAGARVARRRRGRWRAPRTPEPFPPLSAPPWRPFPCFAVRRPRVRLVFGLQGVKGGVVLHLPEPAGGEAAPVRGAPGLQKSPSWAAALASAISLERSAWE